VYAVLNGHKTGKESQLLVEDVYAKKARSIREVETNGDRRSTEPEKANPVKT
jgi:hypothetical protein